MKIKKILVEMFLVLIMLSIPTIANASVFYDVSGNSSVGWNPEGVSLYSSSSTTATVDQIAVISKIYNYGYYVDIVANSADNSSFISTFNVSSLFGPVDLLSTHNATDWTGDETAYSSSSLYR